MSTGRWCLVDRGEAVTLSPRDRLVAAALALPKPTSEYCRWCGRLTGHHLPCPWATFEFAVQAVIDGAMAPVVGEPSP